VGEAANLPLLITEKEKEEMEKKKGKEKIQQLPHANIQKLDEDLIFYRKSD
jgi:hypothetical protein